DRRSPRAGRSCRSPFHQAVHPAFPAPEELPPAQGSSAVVYSGAHPQHPPGRAGAAGGRTTAARRTAAGFSNAASRGSANVRAGSDGVISSIVLVPGVLRDNRSAAAIAWVVLRDPAVISPRVRH